MAYSPRRRSIALVVSLAVAASSAVAEDVAEELGSFSRFAPGDRYELVLESDTATTASARGSSRSGFEEHVRLTYRSDVLVLETDQHGVPLRERHENASLTFERPDESGSLFREGAVFEAQRIEDGVVLFVGERKASEPVQRVVGELLAERLDRVEIARWLAPTGEVGEGDSWPLDGDQAVRLLAKKGLRVIELAASPTATLEESDGERFVHYQIPVAALELIAPARGAGATRSEALLEGRHPLPAEGAHAGVGTQYSASFSLDLRGATFLPKPAVAWSARSSVSRLASRRPRWRLQRTQQLEQQIVRLDQVAQSE